MVLSLSPDVLVAANSVLAGITAFGGIACLAIWRYDRTQRVFFWASLLSITMTMTLLCGAAVFAMPGTESTRWAAFLRAMAYGGCGLLAIQAARHLLPGLPVRWIVRGLAVLLVVRLALWLPTELLARNELTADGWPQYGPLMWTAGLYNVGVITAGVLAYRRSTGKARPVILACGVPVLALTIAPAFVDSGPALEQILTLNVLPGGVAILVLAGRALLRTARGHDTLTRRQELLLRLGGLAVSEPIDTLRRHVERELRAELRRDLVVAISGPDRFPQPGIPGATIRVSGRRQRAVVRGLGPVPKATAQFVEAAMTILLAASERALGDADVAHAADHDRLTGLLNLAALTSRLGDRMHDDEDARVVLVLCRLDDLGRLAAVDGQDQVDGVLTEVSAVLTTLRRSRTTLARVSTATFAVADEVPVDATAAFAANRLEQLRTAITAAVPTTHLRIGVATATPRSTPASLLSDAAIALERAPLGGDAVFDDQIGADVRSGAALERDLEHAVARDEIEVVYQPVATVSSRTVIAVEALARWRRAGVVTRPDVWIPAAERLGLIHEIGRRVLAIAARDEVRLGVPVAVNVSPLQLAEPTFAADVLAAIGDCPPDRIVLEMTETAVMADLDRSATLLQELRSQGIRIALDDFGSSYSSLSALADLPVDILKLDSSFVARLDQANGVAVVQAVVALGRSLGKPIVAEGVETEEQFELLRALSVDRVQGYLLGRPATVDRLAGRFDGPAPTASGETGPPRLFVVGPVAEIR